MPRKPIVDDPEFTPNNALPLPDAVADFGGLLRKLRNNHGYSMQRLSKMIGLDVDTISRTELSKIDLPPENQLIIWLHKLGCGRNIKKLLQISRQFRVKHVVMLHRSESCNPDMIRLLDAYRDEKLTDYDRALLQLVARK